MKVGVSPLDELLGGVLRGERREARFEPAGDRRGGEGRPYGIDALGGVVERRPGHHAHHPVAAESHDQVVRPQSTPQRLRRPTHQPIAGGVIVRSAGPIRIDDDGGRDQRARSPSRLRDLGVDLDEAGAPRSRPRKRVGLRRGELLEQRLAIRACLFAVPSGSLAVDRRLQTIESGSRPSAGGGGSVGGREATVFRRTAEDLGAGQRRLVERPGGVPSTQRFVPDGGSSVAGGRGTVALVGVAVPDGRTLESCLSGDTTLSGGAVADLARRSIRPMVAALGSIAIARGLVLVGGRLV